MRMTVKKTTMIIIIVNMIEMTEEMTEEMIEEMIEEIEEIIGGDDVIYSIV